MSGPADFQPIDTVRLLDEERAECESKLRAMSPPGQRLCVKEELADEFQRGWIAFVLVSRANRFLILASSRPELREQAALTAAKACTIYPLSVNFYECERILDSLGQLDGAKLMYQEFVRRHALQQPTAVGRSWLKQYDVSELLATAQRRAQEINI